jgi:hypothetical protein
MHGQFSRFDDLEFDWNPELRNEAKRYLTSIQHKLKQLTPGGKRLLALLLTAFNASLSDTVNRKQIAAILGRPKGLTPHDRKLLDTLCDTGFLTCERVPLRTINNQPRGAAFEYSMPEDVGWALNKLRTQSRKKRFKQRKRKDLP